MSFLLIQQLIGLITIIYHLVYLVILFVLDCDLGLYLHAKFGKTIDTLNGKVIWIVGASSGIGEHLAYVLSKHGCKIILSARRLQELQKVADNCSTLGKALKGSETGSVEVLPLDVTNEKQQDEAFSHVLKKYGKIDILVNNAGRSQRATWEDIDVQVDRDMFELNVFSILRLSRMVFQHFKSRGKGHFVVTSSVAGISGAPFSGTYTASKHALHGYFESLRNEKMNPNFPITMVCPGPVKTDFLQEAFTAEPGVKFGQNMKDTTHKITAERCAELMAIAIANELPEVWLATGSILRILYLTHYYPNIGRFIMRKLGPVYLQRLRDTKVTVESK